MKFKSMMIESLDETGTGLARLANLSLVDSDGDTYAPGAFGWKEGGGQWLQMITAHNRMKMPWGKAWLYEKDGWALADFTLNLETQAGKEWHSTLKFDLAKGQPVQEWSYGYYVLDADYQVRGDQRVQVLKKLDVYEISPVLRGAGVGTGTVSVKSAEMKEQKFAPLIASLGELADALPDDPAALSATGVKQLEDIEAAIGATLQPLRDQAVKERTAVDTALAGYLLHQSRTHLRG